MEEAEHVDILTADDEIVEINLVPFLKESEYFRCLRGSGMREIVEKKIELPAVSSLAMKLLRLYVGENRLRDIKTALTLENLDDVIIASNYLQMDRLLVMCADFLQDNITVDNCKHYFTVGVDLMIPSIQKIGEDFTKVHFDEFIKTQDFLSLSHEEVKEYLASDDLNPSKEMNVFHAAISWIKESKHRSISNKTIDIFQFIRFGHLTSEEIKECVRTCTELQVDQKCVALFAKIQRVDRESSILNEECDHWYKMRKGNSVQSIFVTGGFTSISESSTNRVQFVDLGNLPKELTQGQNSNKKRTSDSTEKAKFLATKSTRMPVNLCEHCSCVVDDYLYIAGGQTRYRVNGSSTQSQVWRFDPRTVSWKEMSAMRQPRSLFCMLELDNYIYAVCGWKAPETVNRSVERYDPRTDTWQYVAPISMCLHEHAGCTYDGHMYITGGYKGPLRGHLDLTWRYNPRADTWTPLATMIQARSYHAMVALDTQGKLLVAGGVGTNQQDEFEDIQHCELYDPVTDQWTMLLTPIPRPASCMPALVMGSALCLFGGHSFEDSTKRHGAIQTLNTENWTWTETGMESHGILFFGLSVLRLPKCLYGKPDGVCMQ